MIDGRLQVSLADFNALRRGGRLFLEQTARLEVDGRETGRVNVGESLVESMNGR